MILNTWIFNFESILPLLKQSLQSSDTFIEINVLAPESPHTQNRGIELNMKDLEHTIMENLKNLNFFLKSLNESQRKRVKIYKFDSAPKITIYACGKKAFVGIFWPGLHAAHGPQFLIEGDEGHFARAVWEYYSNLSKKEITNDLLEPEAITPNLRL